MAPGLAASEDSADHRPERRSTPGRQLRRRAPASSATARWTTRSSIRASQAPRTTTPSSGTARPTRTERFARSARAPPTCKRPGETAAYWMPTKFSEREPQSCLAARRSTTGAPRSSLSARSPAGSGQVAGDAHAMKAQPLRVTFWNCGVEGGVPRSSSGPTLPGRRREQPATARQLRGAAGTERGLDSSESPQPPRPCGGRLPGDPSGAGAGSSRSSTATGSRAGRASPSPRADSSPATRGSSTPWDQPTLRTARPELASNAAAPLRPGRVGALPLEQLQGT